MKSSVLTLLAGVLLLLAACSTPSEQVNLEDGTRGHRITCGGPMSKVSDCFKQAGSLCGNKGYSVVREIDIKPPGDEDYFWNAAAHEVLIKCNTVEMGPQ